ncbi:ankyrin repeat-containing domain protein [Mycena rosella]|uniref:Ankyrin repeat-containing domain protein n=1 Tax=Mycena rosella TaxID=1033263 RepID=A0AAD7DKT8_MYCRO|nr:ankyrin repeat-containing domain protein [Mycena rosella]
MSATGGIASESSTLEISEIRVSCAKPTKLRAVVSAKILSTDSARQIGEAESKEAELKLSIRVSPSSAVSNGKLFSILVYQQHRWWSDERLLKAEFSVETLLKHCTGQSESKLYEIFRDSKSNITLRAELLEVRNEPASLDPSAVQVPAGATKPKASEGTDGSDSVLSNLLIALDIVQQVGSIVQSVPFIAPIGAILSEFITVYKEVKDNHGKGDSLLEKAAVLAGDIGGAILRLKDNGNVEWSDRLKSDLEEYMGLLEEARNLTIASDQRGGFSRIFKREELGDELDSLDKKLDFFGTRFRNNRLVDIQIEQSKVGNNVVTLLDAARDSKLEEERTKILDWLSPINFFQRHAEISAVRQEGTGHWLLADVCFKEWKAESGGILWCRGISGVGKTVLASMVVDHLKLQFQNNNIGVACIYLNHKETETQTPSNLLAGLWRQLVFEKTISAQSLVHQLFQKHSETRTTPSLDEIHAVLCSVVAEWSKVYIVVDGLDEYPDDERVILLKRLTVIQPAVSLLLTSRPHINLVMLPLHLKTLEIRASDEDIRKFLEQRIQDSSRLSFLMQNRPELRDDIITKIQSTADGMFLLAKLHIESLATKSNIKVLREALQKLPADIKQTYDDAMARINEQNEDDRKIALEALAWVATAKRLLTVAELREALAVEPGAKSLDPDNFTDIGIILAVCAGLVIVDTKVADGKYVWDEEASPTVRLVHYTTQGYLDGLFPDAHADITRVLLTYLAFDDRYAKDHISLYLAGVPHALLRYSPYCLLHAAGEPEVLVRDMIVDFLGRAFEWRNVWPSYASPPWSFENWGIGETPALWVAASANLQEIAKHLLDRGSSPNDMAALGTYPLYVASYYGYLQMAQLLIERGALVNAVSGYKEGTALQGAAAQGHIELVQFLLNKGATIDPAGGSYGSALQSAARAGHTEVVRLLLDKGATVDGASGTYGNALQAAAHEGHTEVVQLLLDKGANVDAAGGGYGSALLAAALNGHTEVVQSLLNKGTSVVWEGGGALQVASQQGHIEIIRLLLEKGTGMDAETSDYGSALRAAAEKGRIEIVRLLLDKGSTNVDWAGGGALQVAAQQGHIEIVRLLLDKGADIDAETDSYGSALHAAAEQGRTEIVRLLLDRGANVDWKGEYYTGPLYAAALKGDVEIFQMLFDKAANVDKAGERYRSALQAAAEQGHTEIVRIILDKDTNVGLGENIYLEPLLSAASEGYTGIIELLLDKGANADAPGGSDGLSALQAASQNGHTEVVQLLLDKGANADAAGGSDGLSALQAASQNGYTEVVELLLKRGAHLAT